MNRPLVIAHHLIWTAYGWWLPNDPRGSSSHHIKSDTIDRLGDLHEGRKKVQPASREIRNFYDRAKEWLRYELLTFDAACIRALGDAFANVIDQHHYTCYACAIMPDHVHLLIRKHKHTAEQMIANLQDASRLRLRASSLRPADHPTWGGPGWKVFLYHPDEIHRTIRYIDDNPLPLRMPPQRWSFVTDYDDWPLHAGHSPNSPYARALRKVGRYP